MIQQALTNNKHPLHLTWTISASVCSNCKITHPLVIKGGWGIFELSMELFAKGQSLKNHGGSSR
jgi:hypothetical protein